MADKTCESEQQRGTHFRKNIKGCGYTILCLLVLMLVCAIWLLASQTAFMRQAARYEKVNAGMSERQVAETFGRPPDFTCNYGNSKILYYYSGHLFSDEGKVKEHPERFPTSVASKDKIPDMYGCFEVLIGPDGKTRAVTWNGETTHIRTKDGKVPGAHVSVLPESMFE